MCARACPPAPQRAREAPARVRAGQCSFKPGKVGMSVSLIPGQIAACCGGDVRTKQPEAVGPWVLGVLGGRTLWSGPVSHEDCLGDAPQNLRGYCSLRPLRLHNVIAESAC